jgi:hypothetical protein
MIEREPGVGSRHRQHIPRTGGGNVERLHHTWILPSDAVVWCSLNGSHAVASTALCTLAGIWRCSCWPIEHLAADCVGL